MSWHEGHNSIKFSLGFFHIKLTTHVARHFTEKGNSIQSYGQIQSQVDPFQLILTNAVELNVLFKLFFCFFKSIETLI